MELKRKERIDKGIKVRTDGIYAISSLREIMYLVGPRLILILGLLLAPFILELAPYWKRVLNVMCVYAVLAICFDYLANIVGLVCLGGSLFIGVGGYLTAIYNSYFSIPYYLSIPMAAVSGALFCTIIILPCLSLRGVYFAIVTLMYPLLITRIIEALDILGGTNGITGIDSFPNQYVENYLIVAFLLVVLFSMRRFISEDIGMIMRGLKDNDQSIRASGINVTWMKSVSVFIASFIGCFAGAYLAHLYMWAGLSLFALDFSIIPIASVAIGGGGSLIGAVVGSLLLVPLSESLRVFGTFRIVIYCIVLTGFLVLKSEGILSYASRKYYQFERWKKI